MSRRYPTDAPRSTALDDLPDADLVAACAWLRAVRSTRELSWPLAPGVRGLIRAGLLRGRVRGDRYIGRLVRGGHR